MPQRREVTTELPIHLPSHSSSAPARSPAPSRSAAVSLRGRLTVVAALAGATCVGALAAFVVVASSAGAGLAAGGRVAVLTLLALIALAAMAVVVAALRVLHTAVRPLEGAAREMGGAATVDRGETDREVAGVLGRLDGVASDLRARQADLDRSRTAFRQAVTRMGDVLAATHDLAGIVDALIETALLVIPGDAAVFYEMAAAPDRLIATHARGADVVGSRIRGTGLAGLAAATRGVALLRPDRPRAVAGPGPRLALTPADLDPAEPPSVAGVAVPLRSRGRILGVLAVYGTTDARWFGNEDVALLVSLLRQAEVAVANIELHEQTRREALTDGVTGLWNRRHFDLRLRDAVAASQRFHEPFAVAIFDLDNFKRINDTWDHFTGDAALVHFAALLRRATRDVDVPCRWGGEEFAVLLQRAGTDDALIVAQRVVDVLRVTPLDRNGSTISMTVSGGVATFPDDGASGPDVVAAADGALLRAKALGKDRVERAVPILPGDSRTLVVDVTDVGLVARRPSGG